jgi:hypothetical protein
MRHRTLRRESSPLYLAEGWKAAASGCRFGRRQECIAGRRPQDVQRLAERHEPIDIYKFRRSTAARPVRRQTHRRFSGDFDLQLVQDKNTTSRLITARSSILR